MVNTQAAVITKSYIVDILNQLNLNYKNTKHERKEIANSLRETEEEFSILEEVELLTVNLRGYGNQINAIGHIENEPQAIEALQRMTVFEIPTIAQFYFSANNKNYSEMKSYLRMLDYLRLLILEYLRSYQGSIQSQ